MATPSDPIDEDDTPDEREILRIGEKALDEVGRTFEHWLDVARGLDIGRRKMLRATGANEDIHDRFLSEGL